MNRKSVALALLGIIGSGLLAGCTYPPLVTYNVTDIGLDFINPMGSSLNDSGVVVGGIDGEGGSTAAVWIDNTLSQIVVSDGQYTLASGVSDDGVLVGIEGLPPISSARTWLYGSPGQSGLTYGGELLAINDSGIAVGGTGSDALAQDGARYYLLANPFGGPSAALDVNAQGQIVGYGAFDSSPSSSSALLWEPLSTTDLGGLGGDSSLATAINDHSVVVGASTLAPDAPKCHAWVWTDDVITDLGALDSASSSWANDVNNAKRIVGWSDTSGGPRHAVLWQWDSQAKKYVLYDLNGFIRDHTLVLNEALDINNHGQIVARGTRNELTVYVLLDPSGQSAAK